MKTNQDEPVNAADPSIHSGQERRRRADDDELRLRVQERTAELIKANEALRIEITGYKRAKEELRDLSKFPSENPNPVLRIARDGTVLYVNEAGLRLLTQWHLEVGHASPPVLRKAVRRSMDDGSTQEVDLEYCERVCSFFVAPVVAAGYANLYGRDITERRRAEEALVKSETSHRSLFDNMVEGVAYCRMLFEDGRPRDFVYLAVNGAFETLTGLKNVTGRRASEVIPGIRETDPQLFEIYGRVALTGQHERFESCVAALGMWFSVSAYSPAKEHFVAVFDVITERKAAEERMRTFSREIIAAREEERKQVSSVLHHDVGSLAVGISAHLDAIEGDLRSGKPGEALKWTKRTRKLFGESVARLKEVAVQLRPPELDALGLCAALRQHFSRVTKHGSTRIHFRETLGRKRVSGDAATTLFRVAQETLTNAITHGDAKQVDVFLSASKNKVKLTVRDNGKGFNPSKQLARETSQMGLGVMKEMADSSGGGFEIHSRRGKGTTVRVSLPLATAEGSGP